MWQYLLGALSGLVLGIIANLLTPSVKPMWLALRSWQDRGYHSHLSKQIGNVQASLDQHNLLTAPGSIRHLLLVLFQGLMALLAIFFLAVTCLAIGLRGLTRINLSTQWLSYY